MANRVNQVTRGADHYVTVVKEMGTDPLRHPGKGLHSGDDPLRHRGWSTAGKVTSQQTLTDR